MDYFLSESSNIVVGEDMLCTLCMIDTCTSLYVSQYSGYYYRINPNSISNTVRIHDFDGAMVLIDKLDKYFPQFYDAISGLLKDRIYVYTLAMASHLPYKGYKQLMSKKLDQNIMDRISRKTNVCGFKEDVIFFLIKRKSWRTIWLCKYVNDKMKSWIKK